jgi:hypothetical protein
MGGATVHSHGPCQLLYGSRLVRALLETRQGPVLRGGGSSNLLPAGARRRTPLARAA